MMDLELTELTLPIEPTLPTQPTSPTESTLPSKRPFSQKNETSASKTPSAPAKQQTPSLGDAAATTAQLSDHQPNQSSDSSKLVSQHDILVLADQLRAVGGSAFNRQTKELIIQDNGAGFDHTAKLLHSGSRPVSYQLWITHHVTGDGAHMEVNVNGKIQRQKLLNMSLDKIEKIVYKSGKRTPIKRLKKSPPSYYFREYCGEYRGTDNFDLSVLYEHEQPIKVLNVEWIKVDRYRPELEPFLFSTIDYYDKGYVDHGLVRSCYRQDKMDFEGVSSTAVCGIALTAFAMNHTLGRDPHAEQKALTLLKTLNNKNPKSKVRLERHSSGLFRHFINAKTGRSKSEFSTIDSSILISGALVARNTFENPEISALADELWNSIHWDQFVISADPRDPRFYLSAAQMDDPNNTRSIGMYNEYILLAYYCQIYENFQRGDRARKHIMPDLFELPLLVYDNRLMVAKHIQPSFLVQFPYYMSSLCEDHLFMGYTAAQGHSDRQHGINRFSQQEAWGVSPGNTPKQGYEVTSFLQNPEGVVGPRMVAGFMSTVPSAVDDYLALASDTNRHLKTMFGTILPRFAPQEKDWKPWRFAAVDFSCGLYGLASMHPKLGMKWIKEKNRFTFRQKKKKP
jgi:hypothetical protein